MDENGAPTRASFSVYFLLFEQLDGFDCVFFFGPWLRLSLCRRVEVVGKVLLVG